MQHTNIDNTIHQLETLIVKAPDHKSRETLKKLLRKQYKILEDKLVEDNVLINNSFSAI